MDSEIENYEQMMNFHCIMILENFLNEMIQNLIDENFEEFQRKREEIFSSISNDFWQKQQSLYDSFLYQKEETLFQKIKGSLYEN